MANYDVNIVNGVGSKAMQKGNYEVSVTATGYDNSTLTPTTYSVTDTEGTGFFTVTANGTLTFEVNETGETGGTPITAGTMVMTDSTGNTQYGSVVNISNTGTATFTNVPYDQTNPITLYFVQPTSDATHNAYEGVITVTMNAQTITQVIQNRPIATQTFNLTDATYIGLPINNATLTFTGGQSK